MPTETHAEGSGEDPSGEGRPRSDLLQGPLGPPLWRLTWPLLGGHLFQVDIVGKRHRPRVYRQYRSSTAAIRQIQRDVPVEPPRSQQR